MLLPKQLDDCHKVVPRVLFQGFYFSVPVGHHVHLRGEVGGMEIVRSYTPVHSRLDAADDGRLHFLIKIYPDGALTPMIEKVPKGEGFEM